MPGQHMDVRQAVNPDCCSLCTRNRTDGCRVLLPRDGSLGSAHLYVLCDECGRWWFEYPVIKETSERLVEANSTEARFGQ